MAVLGGMRTIHYSALSARLRSIVIECLSAPSANDVIRPRPPSSFVCSNYSMPSINGAWRIGESGRFPMRTLQARGMTLSWFQR